MSNTSDRADVIECPNQACEPTVRLLPSRRSVLGNGLPINRLLPNQHQRRIGPWCFLDHIGPTQLSADNGVDVGTHPHIGLQTVTWLYEGAMLHKDSLDYEQVIRPGQLNLMTAGHGICHSEESPPHSAGAIHGLQFWIALPAEHEDTEPAFEHLTELPQWRQNQVDLTLVVGELEGRRAPGRVFSPLVGVDLYAREETSLTLTVPPEFELGLCVTAGRSDVDCHSLEAGSLTYLGRGRHSLSLTLSRGARAMLLGGTPLDQPVLLWWNFVARDRERIAEALADWDNAPNARFGEVAAYQGKPLTAPPLDPSVRLK